jgi:hypothetical protein
VALATGADIYEGLGVAVVSIATFFALLYHALEVRRSADAVRDAIAGSFVLVYLLLVISSTWFVGGAPPLDPAAVTLLNSFTTVAGVFSASTSPQGLWKSISRVGGLTSRPSAPGSHRVGIPRKTVRCRRATHRPSAPSAGRLRLAFRCRHRTALLARRRRNATGVQRPDEQLTAPVRFV